MISQIDSTIILIGPMSAGKSVIGKLLAEKLGFRGHALDKDRWDYYQEIGYDDAVADQIRESEGMLGLMRYWKPFEAHAVERTLADNADCVIDFGAGHSVYEDEALFARVQNALQPYKNVILLLPCPDLDESVAILNDRFGKLLLKEVGEIDERLFAVNEHFVKHPSNHKLAKMTIYTNGKTPEETCDEIVGKLSDQ